MPDPVVSDAASNDRQSRPASPTDPKPAIDPISKADDLLAEAVEMVVLAAGCTQDRSDRFALIDVRDILRVARTMLGRR